ncbi:hypothetical protein [Treponema sp.]|uniref:hypothetical protein n=1 Tax=Treponema sp. TaxID=166 RepID=UPI003890C012
MKKANAIIFSVIFVVYSLLGISCSSSVGGDDGRSIDSDVVYKELSSSLQLKSFTEYVYDKYNYSDYKEIREYKSSGVLLDTIEFFYYSKDEAEDCPLGNAIKNELLADFDRISYNKDSETGRYVSILCSVDSEGKQKPVEKSYYTKVKSGVYSSQLAVTYDFDDSGNLKKDKPCDIIFDGFVDSVVNTTIEYKKLSEGSNPSVYKNVRLCFSPETDNSVSYYRVIEVDNNKLKNVAFQETEYWTYGLTCNASNINADTDLNGDFTFTLNKAPKFSYRNLIPDDKYDPTKTEWYQVNRTINFFEASSDRITNTLYTLYKMSWDTELYENGFILQSEFNTNEDFSEVGDRIKTVSIIPETRNRLRAYLFIYGDSTQQKTSFSYAPYPKIQDTPGNSKADEYNNQIDGKFYISKETYFKRKSEESLDLMEDSNYQNHFYFQDGYLINQVVEYDSGSSVDVNDGPFSGDPDMSRSLDNRSLRMIMD